MGIFKFSDPPYGGSNEVFGKNQNFPLFLNIKLHLKMPVNFNFLNILSFLGGSVYHYEYHVKSYDLKVEKSKSSLC